MSVVLPQGGIAHYSYALAEALHEVGVDSDVLVYDEPAYDLEAYPCQHRIVRSLRPGTSFGKRLKSPLLNLAAVLRAAVGRRLMHVQWSLGPRNDRLIWPALRAAGKPIVYTAHDVLPHEADILPRSHCAWIYRGADALIVHGEQAKTLLLETFQVAAEKVHVIPHGNYNFVADLDRRWNRTSARASLGCDDDDRVVLFFGLIREYKGLDLLIDACQAIHRRGLPGGQRLRLVIAGRSFKNHWEDAGYAERIQRANLSDRLTLHLGHIAMLEIPRFFRAADVVAVPYRRGSQSGVLQLAHSFGKASVATRVGSFAEGPANQISRFVAANNPEALEQALFELLENHEQAEQLGKAARAYADTELGWRSIALKTRSVYDSL